MLQLGLRHFVQTVGEQLISSFYAPSTACCLYETMKDLFLGLNFRCHIIPNRDAEVYCNSLTLNFCFDYDLANEVYSQQSLPLGWYLSVWSLLSYGILN